MKATLVMEERLALAENAFAEIVIWHLPSPLRGSAHPFKYRLALVVDGVCVLRYDNETGKGDHRHWGDEEWPYMFISHEQLLADFWNDVEKWEF